MFFRTYQILKLQVKGEIGELCLSLCAFRNGLYIPSGTATSIAPNFAITAKHVIDDYFEQLQQEFLNFEGEKEVLFGMVALQPFSYTKILSVWQVDKVFQNALTDITYIHLTPSLKEQLNYKWQYMHLEMLPPKEGSIVHAVGYRESQVFPDLKPGQINLKETLSFSVGSVQEIYQEKRDLVRLNFPCIRTNARYDGGMSGGPIIKKKEGYAL